MSDPAGLTSLETLTGEYLEEVAADGYVVPFECLVDGYQRTVVAVLQRTVIYLCPERDDRLVAKFNRVLVDPDCVHVRTSRRRSLAGHRVSRSGLAPRRCRTCRADFQPLQPAHLYCSKLCQNRYNEEHRGARGRCAHCKKRKSDIDTGSYCVECRREYNRLYWLRHRDGTDGIITAARHLSPTGTE